MAVHAKAAAGVVDIVVVTQDAVFVGMVEMCEVHWQDRLQAAVVIIAYRCFLRDRRAKCDNQDSQQDRYPKYYLHTGIFLMAAKAAATTTLTTRYALFFATGICPSLIQYARPKATAMASKANNRPWYHAPR